MITIYDIDGIPHKAKLSDGFPEVNYNDNGEEPPHFCLL